MGKNAKIRIIVWSVLAFICLCLGGTGFFKNYTDNKITGEEKIMLENIAKLFDSSSDFDILKKTGIKIETKLKGKTLETVFTGESSTNIYKFEYQSDKKILNFKCLSSDSFSIVTLKNMLEAISVYQGNPTGEASEIFENIIDLTAYSLDDGFTYNEEKGYIIASLNIKTPIKKMENNYNYNINDFEEELKYAKYFVVDDLLNYKTNIIEGGFSTTKNNIKLLSYRIGDTIYVDIAEDSSLSDLSFRSMKNVLLTLIKEDIYYKFEESYKGFTNGSKTIEGITVEVNPAFNDNEIDSILSTDKFVRISFDKSLLMN